MDKEFLLFILFWSFIFLVVGPLLIMFLMSVPTKAIIILILLRLLLI
jgi:hypothetical protein